MKESEKSVPFRIKIHKQEKYTWRKFERMYDGTFKIILFGDPNVGKKSLTPRFLTNLFVSDQTMAIGVDFEAFIAMLMLINITKKN